MEELTQRLTEAISGASTADITDALAIALALRGDESRSIAIDIYEARRVAGGVDSAQHYHSAGTSADDEAAESELVSLVDWMTQRRHDR